MHITIIENNTTTIKYYNERNVMLRSDYIRLSSSKVHELGYLAIETYSINCNANHRAIDKMMVAKVKTMDGIMRRLYNVSAVHWVKDDTDFPMVTFESAGMAEDDVTYLIDAISTIDLMEVKKRNHYKFNGVPV